MNILFNKKKILKITLFNVVLLLAIYYLTSNFYKKLIPSQKITISLVPVNNLMFELNNYRNDETNFFFSSKDIFILNDYYDYLIKEKKIISSSSCPPEIKSNNLRNVYIHNVSITKYSATFDVSLVVNQSSKNNIECLNYIFVEKLNIYFLDQIKKRKLMIKSEINYLKVVKKLLTEEGKRTLNEQLAFPINQGQSILDLNLDLKIIQAELLYKFYDEQIKFFVEPSGIIKKNFEIDDNKNNLFITISFLFVALQMAFFYLKKKKLNLLKNFFK